MYRLLPQGSAGPMEFLLGFLAWLLVAVPALAQTNDAPSPIHIYLDADRTHNLASALAIERGLQVALDEVGNTLQGRPVVLVALDHRGNSVRSKRNMDKAFASPNTLFLMAGMHSPPLIKYRDYINEQQMLTLVPWAAGGPITRYPSKDNWIFRLSVDDTKAGQRLAQHALEAKRCKNPHLLLERTPWGASNERSLSASIHARLGFEPVVNWFNWDVSDETARITLRSIVQSQADCLIFVGNSRDGGTIMNAAYSLKEWDGIPVISHWGLTGGNFYARVPHEARVALDLNVLQTCFSFISSRQTPRTQSVLRLAKTRYPDIQSPNDIKSPAGFIHAYDLGRLMLAAINRITLTDDMNANRKALRAALEQIAGPVEGLVKTYRKPFGKFSQATPDAHEALGLNDLCMARYTAHNTIELLPSP